MSIGQHMTHKLPIGRSAVSPGPGQERIRYDMGKYRRNLAGEIVDVRRGVKAVWCVRRKDADGPYFALMCVVDRV